MAGQGGLFIKILGGVSEELLSGLATLSDQLKKLSETAKKTKNIEFGNGIAEIGQQVEATSARIGAGLKKIEQFVSGYGDAMASAIDKQDEAAKRAAASTGESFGKIRKDIQDTYGEKQRKLIEQIQQRMEKFGDLSEVDMPTSQTQLKEFAKQIHDLYSSLQDVGAIDESSQTLEQFANKIDYAAVASKRITKEIKETGDGFRAYSNDARIALGLTKEQNDALAKFKGPSIFEKKLEELRKEQEAGTADAKEYANALQFLAQRFGKSDKEATQYVKVLDNVRKNIDRLSTEAKAMGFPNIAENIQKIKPATAVLRALDGSLKVTKTSMEMVTDEAKKMFKGLSTSEINELINTLDLMPKKAAEIRKVADSFTYSDAEAEQFQKELQALYKELDRLSKVDIKVLEGPELKVFEKDINAARSGINKFGGALKVLEGQEGFTQLRTDIERVDIAVKEHRKSLADAAAEQKRYEKEQELTQQTLRDVEKSLRSLSEAELKTFDVEDTRRWKRELERTESTLDNIRKKVPDEEFERLKNNISDARREADKYATTMRKAAQQMDTKGQEQAMMNLAKHYGDSTSRINRYKKAVRDTVEMEQRRMDQIMNKIDRLRSEKKQTEAVTKEIRRLALEYDRLANEEDLSRRVKDRYEEQVKGVSRAHSRLTKELKLSGKEMGFVANQIDHVSRRIKQFGAFVAAAFVVRQVQFFFRELIRVTAEYDQALYNLRAIMEITSSQVHVLGEVIKDVARNTKFSAQEIAKGIQTLGQAGLSMQESMQAVQGIADLATGTLSSFAEVSELVTTTLNSFQLAATESARAADIFANAVNNSKLTVEKLNTVFNYVGAAGKQVGLNLNELTGSLMSLADRGIRASTMGTGLRRTMLQMIDPSRELVADLGVLGKRVEDINPKLVGWQNALKELTPLLWDARRETVDMAKVSQYFGNRAAQVAAVLIETVNSTSNSLTEAIEKTYEFGSAGRMAEIQIEGLGLKLKNLQDRAKNIVIAFGEAGLTGALKNIVDVLRDATTGFEEFINKHPWAAQIGGISTSVLFLTAVISGLIPIVFRAASVFKGLWLIHSGLFTAIGVGTAAISALIFSLNALADRHYKVMKAAGENASEHEALAEAMQSWKETFDEAFQTREWENVVKRFKNTEIAGRNLAEMIEEELQISIERLGQTDVDLSKLENAFDRTALKLHNIRIEDSLQQLRSASDELKWIYKSTGEVALEETLNTFSKTEQFVKERVLDSGLKYANPFYWFNENAEEAVDAYEEAVQSMGDSLIKLAEMSDWSTEDIIKNTAKMRARIIEEVGAESKAVQDFQQMMARTWFGEVNSEIITFQERLKKLNDLIQNDHITTVEEAKKEFGDFALEWEKFETVEDVSKAVSKEFNRLGIEQKKLFPLLQKLSYGGAEFAEVEKYIRTEMGLTVDQSKILIDHLHRLEKDITSQAIPAFNSFLNSIREISPAMAQEIEKLSDAQKAMLLSQKSTIYEAGKELREYYKGIFGGISIDDVGKIDAETLMDQLLKAGYDINNVSEVSDYINEFRENIKKQEARELSSIISDMFEEDLLKLSNNLKQYRLQYEEDSLEMLELEKKLAKERVKIRRQIYNELKNEDTRSDLLEAQQELQDAEEKIVDRKKKLIEDETKKIKKAYDKRIGMLESAAERENLIIEEKVAQGKMLEYNAQEEIAQQTVDLAEKRLAAHTEMISKMSKSSDDYNDALIENKELVNELKEAEINRFEATLSKYEGIFSREKELIELRKQASLAGLQEDTYYRIIENQSGKVIAEFDKQERATYETYKTRLAVEKQSSSEILRLYDQRLQKILALKGKNNDEYRKLLMERTIFEKEQLANIVELERKTAEQRIIAHGTAMEQIKLGLRQYKEEYKTEGEFWVDSSKNFAENMHNSFRDDFFKPFITGTESASDAFHNFTQSILNNMLNILADSITRDFMNVIGLAASGGSTSGGGSSGGDSSSQMAGWASTLFSAVVSYFHKGGVVGKDGEKRFAPASLFKDAPRLHTGLRPNEFPAILEKGETVIPADKSKRDFANTGQSQVNYFNVTVQAPDGNISKESQRQLQRRLTRSVAMANRRA